MTARGRWVLAMGVTALAPVVVMAQDAPPQPSLKNAAAAWVGYLFIAVLLGLVMAVSLMPSRRGHQD